MRYPEKLATLSKNLRKSKKVNSFDVDGEKEADTLAYALLDIEESCKSLITEQIPQLILTNTSEEKIDEILLDIGEELRHILYHVKDPRFYEYLREIDPTGRSLNYAPLWE